MPRYTSIVACLLLTVAAALFSGCQSLANYFEGPESDRAARTVPTSPEVAASEAPEAPALAAEAPEAPSPFRPAATAVAAQPTSAPAPEPLTPPADTVSLEAAAPSPTVAAPEASQPAKVESLPPPTETVSFAPEPATEAPQSIPAELQTIYFDSDSTILSLHNRALLQENARWLLANPGMNIVIEGHTDSTASNEYNISLGAERAQMVASYLESLGVASDRISTVSYGEERPVDPASTRAAHAKNRRVQFLVYRRSEGETPTIEPQALSQAPP